MSAAVRSDRQRGGIGVLAALGLLSLLAILALASSRNVLRELSLAGSELCGSQAFQAADGALACALVELPQQLAAGTLVPVTGAVRPLTAGTVPGLATLRFRVEARYLGRVERSWLLGLPAAADPDPALEQLWELTAHGYCDTTGGHRPSETYHQACQAWVSTPGADPAGPGGAPEASDLPLARLLAWQMLH